MSLIVNMACGLANRMFQYSYYLYLRKKGYNVFTDAYDDGFLPHERVDWYRVFPLAVLNPVNKKIPFFYGGGNNLLSRFRRRYMPSFTNVLQMETAFEVKLPEKENLYIIGCFQSASMVEEVREEVKKAFAFSPIEDIYNQKLVAEMQQSMSVAVHVRKGRDYQQRIWYQNTCPVDYYRRAIEYMQNQLCAPRFYVFADDRDWVRDYFDWFECTLVDGNPSSGNGSHLDMQLMSLCHNNIISNSTYSWWGAYLNAHKNRKVVAPDVWFNPASCEEYRSTCLLCSDWQVF